MTDENTQQDPQDDGMEELKQKIAEAQAEEESSVADYASGEASTARHGTYQEEIEKLKAEKQEAEAQMKRVVADFQNSKRRLEEEKNQFAAFATQKLVLQVLEIYENYTRLLQHEPEGLDAEWRKGFELIQQQFKSFMDAQGVTEVVPEVGEAIDPEKHQAMMTGEGEAGKIIEVFSNGYEMNGRVIKTAMVKVGA